MPDNPIHRDCPLKRNRFEKRRRNATFLTESGRWRNKMVGRRYKIQDHNARARWRLSRCGRLAINVARLPIVVEFHYHDRKAGIISKSLATRRAANEVVGNGAIFMRGRGRYQKRETIIIDGGLSRWAKYVARKTDGDLSGWKDRRRGAARLPMFSSCY